MRRKRKGRKIFVNGFFGIASVIFGVFKKSSPCNQVVGYYGGAMY